MNANSISPQEIELLQLQHEVLRRVALLKNKSLLKQIAELLQKEEQRDYERKIKPMTEAEYLASIDAAEQEYREGKTLTLAQVIQQSENW